MSGAVTQNSAVGGTSEISATDDAQIKDYDGNLAAADADGDNDDYHQQAMASKSKKRKNKKRGPTALTRDRGTGFEEFYADPPITPEEAFEERNEVYNKEKPFVFRIEECIKRFRARRRMSPELTSFFNQYLFLGGVDCGPRMFTGVDDAILKDATPAERRDLTAIDTIHSSSRYTHDTATATGLAQGNPAAIANTATAAGDRFYSSANAHLWDVDFAGVAAGFMTDVVYDVAAYNEVEGMSAVALVENFLRYVRQHDVCPEYDGNLCEALRICQLAKEELPMRNRCYQLFPGEFNLAVAELAINKYHDWQPYSGTAFQHPANFDPQTVFSAAIALAGDQAQFDKVNLSGNVVETLATLRTVDHKGLKEELEVVSLHHPTDEISNIFKGLRIPSVPDFAGVAPIGTAVFKTCRIEDEWDRPVYDDDDYDAGSKTSTAKGSTVTMFLDDAILRQLRPGFKLRAVVCELTNGIKFIKDALAIFPSFHTFLPQALMKGYRQPMENERPAPSVLDPLADDRTMAADMNDI